jgi:hypothetical protein
MIAHDSLQVTTNISALESLLPDLAPNLDRMKVSCSHAEQRGFHTNRPGCL